MIKHKQCDLPLSRHSNQEYQPLFSDVNVGLLAKPWGVWKHPALAWHGEARFTKAIHHFLYHLLPEELVGLTYEDYVNRPELTGMVEWAIDLEIEDLNASRMYGSFTTGVKYTATNAEASYYVNYIWALTADKDLGKYIMYIPSSNKFIYGIQDAEIFDQLFSDNKGDDRISFDSWISTLLDSCNLERDFRQCMIRGAGEWQKRFDGVRHVDLRGETIKECQKYLYNNYKSCKMELIKLYPRMNDWQDTKREYGKFERFLKLEMIRDKP
jgi:hypothetical protein